MRLYCVVVKDTGKIINARMRRAKLLDSLQALKAGWCQGLTLIHVRAQLEPSLTLKTSPTRLKIPSTPAINTP